MGLLTRLIKLFPQTTINVDGKPYLTRHYLLLRDWKWFSINVHFFHSSDQGFELHNHPWKWSFSFVLARGYMEEKTIGIYGEIIKRAVLPGCFNFISNKMFHRVDLIDEKRGAWTLFFAGPRMTEEINGKEVAKWGFLDRETREFKHYTSNPEAIP